MERKIKIKQGGCIIAPPQKSDAIYEQIFAGEVQEPINWELYLPLFENQKNTTGCVSFSRLNCAETFAKKEGLDFNLSDRHLFVLSGTMKSGNSLNAVSEAFRILGIVREEYFNWKPEYLEDQSAHWAEIFDTSSIPAEARRFFGGNHSWVKGKSAMKSALAFSPIQLAIPVGETYFNSAVKPPKNISGYHAVMCYFIDTQGNYYIFDSVDGEKKILDKDYEIMQCKSFRDLPLEWKSITPQERKTILSILGEILRKMAEILGLMKKQVEIITLPPQPVPEPPVKPPDAPTSPSTTIKMAEAIQSFEGWSNGSRSQRNCNPGNMKYTPYTQSLGAIKYDTDNFCIFPNYEKGFSALCQFITDAGNNKLKNYHNCTIKTFFISYSDNSYNYAKYVANYLGAPIDTKISGLV